MVQCLVTLIDL